jgi:hypothetical protein
VPGTWRAIQQSQMRSCSNWTPQSQALPKGRGGGRESTDAFGGICYISFHSASSISRGPISSRSLLWHTIAGSLGTGRSGDERAL